MSVNIKQNADASAGFQGTDGDDGPFIITDFRYTATSASIPIFIAPRRMIVKGVTVRVETAGTDVGAVTATIVRVASGTAIASGTALHSGTADLKGTAATNQALALSTTSTTLDIPAGTAIGVILSGVMTAATGVIMVALAPA